MLIFVCQKRKEIIFYLVKDEHIELATTDLIQFVAFCAFQDMKYIVPNLHGCKCLYAVLKTPERYVERERGRGRKSRGAEERKRESEKTRER